MTGTHEGSRGAQADEPQNPVLSEWQRELLAPFLKALPITGLSLSVSGYSGQESTLAVSDATATELSELQFARGQGPHWKVLATGRPVLVPDVAASAGEWPLFGEALAGLPVGAIFAFPLRIGAAVVGVVDLYSSVPGGLDVRQAQTAAGLAQAATGTAVRRATESANDDAPHPSSPVPETRREVQQATGMILAQLDVSATDAFYRLRMHAFSNGRSLQSVALDVIARSIDFRDLE
ncbi:hypothetical protein B7R54_01095 [Subtercola boreus]|uniref:ANTAR domain-containing protein n=1 Tax=Subtercola boreus TaxID=120213 RepID=A0A3E0VE83_9MICO|nr:GAF and ANTAR domain-containing protein [Subtercola boreus]RFA07965.1 hypothetical protein B7R54_01095 [Subtercola boreus]TQL55170.1 ANTAR domain-containing protein [Subtercola boreus]